MPTVFAGLIQSDFGDPDLPNFEAVSSSVRTSRTTGETTAISNTRTMRQRIIHGIKASKSARARRKLGR